jgi:ribosomal protein L20A (L18A)
MHFAMSGGNFHQYSSDIGDVVSFVPRYHVGGGFVGLRHRQFRRPRLGRGFGSTILNFFKPLFKRGLTEVVDVASKVAGDVISGKNFKESAKSRALEKVGSILGGENFDKRDKIQVADVQPVELIEKKERRLTPATARRKTKIVKKVLKSVKGGGRSYREGRILDKYPALKFL